MNRRQAYCFGVVLMLILTTSTTGMGRFFAPKSGRDWIQREARDSFYKGLDLLTVKTRNVKAIRESLETSVFFTSILNENANTCHNKGNALALAGMIPQAIREYQVGLILEPGDADMRANLEYLRQQVDYPDGRGRPEPDIVPSWLLRPGTTFWYLATLFASTACIVAFVHWRLQRARSAHSPRRWLTASVCLLLLLCLAATGWLALEWQHYQDRIFAPVVVREKTGFFLGNGTSYPSHADMPTLNPGMEARQLLRRGDWVQIRVPNGDMGWVQAQALVDNTILLFREEPPPRF